MSNNLIRNLKNINNARTELEACFNGLPHAPARLVNLLITKANTETGIVENITYSELASLLTVDSYPGRKDSGTPQKQTIRSYLRTIESQYGANFKIISDSQMLKIQFTTLPSIYASHFNCGDVYTPLSMGQHKPKTLINIDQNASNDNKVSTEEYTDLYTSECEQANNACEHACAKIKPNFKPNNNNEKQIVGELVGEIKNTIPDDFQPSQALIDNALRLGLSKVTDSSELTKFIIFNKASGSRWANWDYVYLNWLIRDVEREQEKAVAKLQQPKQNPVYSRRNIDERNRHAAKFGKPTMDDVLYANRDAVAPWECIHHESTGNVITPDDFMVVG